MARRFTSTEQSPQPWPKAMAIRRLKEAADQISNLQGLNHRDLNFQAWRESLSEALRRNWPDESLPFFSESRMRLPGEPGVSGRDVSIYREGLVKTKNQIERILRNERELAEAQADSSVLEIFIPAGTQHDAYQEIRKIISSAGNELIIVDNYVDGSLFTLLTNSNQSVVVRILTFSMPSDFSLEGRKFIQQYRRTVEVRQDRTDFHDRFIIVDGAKAFHLGHSIKDAGNKAMMIHRVEDQRNVIAAIQAFQSAWTSANPVPL